MKKLFYFVAIAFILVCSWQIWQHPETFRSYLGDFSPTACLLPMKYKIVQVDSKFGLKTEDFKIAVAQAVDTWNKNLNKIAFVYDEATPDLKVNLIYDDRQSETQKLNQLNQVISLDKNQYGNLSTQRNALLATYQVDLVKYNSTIESYNNQVAEYQKVVAGWNARGGAPKTEYNSLQTTKRNLETLAANIEIQRQSLNRQVNAINSVTSDVNTAAKVVNQKVNVYNSSDLIGSEFEQGIFILKGFDKQINIYQYDNKAKLLKVLEHELGHALGLDHSSSTASIMYKINTDKQQSVLYSDTKYVLDNCHKVTWWNQLLKKIPFLK